MDATADIKLFYLKNHCFTPNASYEVEVTNNIDSKKIVS